MANAKGLEKQFIPTDKQREDAVLWLNRGANLAQCAISVINPESITKDNPEGDPISVSTFRRVFKKEIREALRANLGDAADCLAAAAKTDPEMASRYINTRGRGFFKERFEIDTNQSYKQQIDQILEAGAKGLINNEEARDYAGIIKQKEESALNRILKLLEGLIDKDQIQSLINGDTDVR